MRYIMFLDWLIVVTNLRQLDDASAIVKQEKYDEERY
jgi:hypothetical protein